MMISMMIMRFGDNRRVDQAFAVNGVFTVTCARTQDFSIARVYPVSGVGDRAVGMGYHDGRRRIGYARANWPPWDASLMDASDEELMARIATGDEPAFRQLARRHLPRVLALARRFTTNEADAEEVAQEALLRVWLTAPRWRPVAAFRTWLYRVVVNLCLNRHRRAPFLPLEAVAEPPDSGPDAMAQIEATEDGRRIAAAIAALPERQRIAIELTYHEGLGNAEAAAALGTTTSGLESLLVRAKQSLRTALRRPTIDRRDE